MNKKAHNRVDKVHKRVYLSKKTNLMLTVMNELMQNDVYDEFIERCILYGLAHINDKNKVDFAKWTDQLILPTVADVDKLTYG